MRNTCYVKLSRVSLGPALVGHHLAHLMQGTIITALLFMAHAWYSMHPSLSCSRQALP